MPTHPTPISLAHVVLRTTPSKYPQMVSFYTFLLSATPAHQNETMTFLRYDHEHHRLAIIQTPSVEPVPENSLMAGLDHIAFTYASLQDLARTYISLKSAKEPILPVWCVNHGPTTSMYYRDPNGTRVELQVDNFETAEEADAFMRGEAFARNPVGVDFEPEEWVARVFKAEQNGEEMESIKVRADIGERSEIPGYS